MSESHEPVIDTSRGWCCDGRTWTEHSHEDGHCCQSEGTKLAELPPEGQRKAKERIASSPGQAVNGMPVRRAGGDDAD